MGWNAAKDVNEAPKILIIGGSGCLKTRTALAAGNSTNGKARMLVLDYEESTKHYTKEFCFAKQRIHKVMEFDSEDAQVTKEEEALLRADRLTYRHLLDNRMVYGVDFARVVMMDRISKNPIDFVCIDSVTDHWDWLASKWKDIFLKKELTSKGNMGDYYTMQVRDYDKPKEDLYEFVEKLKKLNCGVICISQEKDLYAKGEMMKWIGVTADVHKNIIHQMDTCLHLHSEETGKAKSSEGRRLKYIAHRIKDRTDSIPARFVWADESDKDHKGYSKSFLTHMSELLKYEGKATEIQQPEEPIVVTPDKPKEEDSGPSTVDFEVLWAKLALLKKELEITDKQWKAMLDKRNVKTAKQLTYEDGVDLLDKVYSQANLPHQAHLSEMMEQIEHEAIPF